MGHTQPTNDELASRRPRSIAFFYFDLRGGGVQRMMINLAQELAHRGHRIDFLLCRDGSGLHDHLSPDIRVTALKAVPRVLARLYPLAADPKGLGTLLRPVLLARKPSPTLRYLPHLVRYLGRNRPQVLVAATTNLNLEALWARRLASVSTRVLVSQRTLVSWDIAGSEKWRKRYLPPLVGRTYREADAIIAVSNGVAEDLATLTALPRERILTIYNPVVTRDLRSKAEASPNHPWFDPGAPPVILGVGRLATKKDFPTLVRAFTRVRAMRPARLVILGEATDPQKTVERQKELMGLAVQQGVGDDTALLGYVPNPFAYMARASVFVQSSLSEGFGNALVEALACGCPVVSTDCPTGPADILDNGRFGALVPLGDDAAMAKAVLATLDSPPEAESLRVRAQMFSVERAVDRYEELMVGAACEVARDA